MKKIIPGILATAMSFACLAACGESKKPATVDLTDVKTYVDTIFAGKNAETNGDYTLVNSTSYDGKQYSLEWSLGADVKKEDVVLVVSEDGKSTFVDVNEVTPVEITYVLNVKISDGKGNSTNTSFTRKVLACDPYVLAPISATPVEDTIYKLWVFQGATAQNCYVNGNMINTYYFETVEDPDEAIDIYVEFVEGSTTEFYLYYNKEVEAEEDDAAATAEEGTAEKETVKTYITLFQSGTHTNAKYWTLEEIRTETNDATAMPVAYVYNADYGTITTEFGGSTWYFGCDGTYTTVEPQTETGSGYYKGYLTTLTDRATITTTRKFEAEKNNFNFAPVYVDEQDIDVSLRGLTYPDVKIDWTVTGDGASIDGSTISMKAGSASSEIKVKATFSIGREPNVETDTKEWSFKLIPNTADAIFDALAGLEAGQKFGNSSASLTGVITQINTAYDENYGNITFTMQVGENSIYCYRVKGTGADELQVGDTVTVAGGMESYRGTPQFSSGCALIEYTFGPDHNFNPEEPTPGEDTDTDVLASLDMMGTTNLTSATADQTVYTANGITYTNDKASSTNANYTSQSNSSARAYKGSTITIAYTSTFKAAVFTLDDYTYNGSSYLAGFDGMTITGATITRNNDVVTIVFDAAVTTFTTGNLASQVRIEKIELYATAPSTDSTEPVEPNPGEGSDTGALTMVTAPAANTAYHFSFTQTSDGTIYYFKGTLNSQGFYLQGTVNFDESVQVYLEETATAGEYYLYFMNGTTKTYIEMYVSDTHINPQLVTTTPATTYTFDAEYNTLVCAINGGNYFYGSRSDKTYDTFSCTNYAQYITTNYVAHLYTEGEGSGSTTPVEPNPGEDTDKTLSQILDIAYAVESGVTTTETYTLTGTVSSIYAAYDSSYKNVSFYITFEGETRDMLIFRASGAGIAEIIKVGDTVTVVGNFKNYNGTIEMVNGTMSDHVIGEDTTEPADLPADGSTLTIVEALAIDTTKLTGQKYYTVGVITNVYNTQYGNMYIKDADGNEICIYGTYSADGSTAYGDMEVKPAVGDTIKVYGTLSLYNGKNQYKDAWIVEHTPAGSTTPVEPNPGESEVTTTNKADFDTLSNNSSYKNTGVKTTSGWSLDYCAVQSGGTGANPVIPDLLGSDSSTKGVCIVGKTSTPGKVTSCILSGGISKLSFEYGFAFTDTQFSITISIKSADGSTVLDSTTFTKTDWEKYKKDTFVWELEEEIQGDFIIEIVNNCLSEEDGNKDRLTIWNLTWENATSKENA